MFERFTDRARLAVAIADQKAIEMHHGYIGTEHLLLGIVLSGECMANNVLKSLDIKLEMVLYVVERLLVDGNDAACGKLPMTPGANAALKHAIAEANTLQHNYVGTEHMLLGLMYDQTLIAGTVLTSLGLKLEAVRKSIVEILGDAPDEPNAPLPAACGSVVSAYGEHSLTPLMAARSWATVLTLTPEWERAVDNLSRTETANFEKHC